MKLADAEKLLALEKRQGPLKEPWSALTEEGILLEAWPLGFARGSQAMCELSVRPRLQFSALFTGGTVRHLHFSGHHGVFGTGLWEQEFYVYMKELKREIAESLKDLKGAPMYMRKNEKVFSPKDPTPHQEDFVGGYGTRKGEANDLPTQVEHTAGALTWTFSIDPLFNLKNLYAETEAIKQGFCDLLSQFIEQGEQLWQTPAQETAEVLYTNMPFYIIPSRRKTKRKGTSIPSPS